MDRIWNLNVHDSNTKQKFKQPCHHIRKQDNSKSLNYLIGNKNERSNENNILSSY
jgi:hypothetical protein